MFYLICCVISITTKDGAIIAHNYDCHTEFHDGQNVHNGTTTINKVLYNIVAGPLQLFDIANLSP